MSDQVKTTDQVEEGGKTANDRLEKPPDAQAARVAGADQIVAAQELNPNRHNGSAGGDGDESIQIVGIDDNGQRRIIAERPREAEQKPQAEITLEYLQDKAKFGDVYAETFVKELEIAEKLTPGPEKDRLISQTLWKAKRIFAPDQTKTTGNEEEQKDYGKVYESPAGQAVEPMPPVSETIMNAPDASPVVLNVQITNVPEVSAPVSPENALQHLNQAFEAGVQAVKPIEQWMATQNAVTDALVGIGPVLDKAVNYYANTPADQVAADVQTGFTEVGEAVDRTFSYAHTPEERAKTAGEIMPFIFTDGLGTTGESATLKTADAVATHVDATVIQTIEKSLDAIKKAPDLAADIKQGLYEFLKVSGLTAQEVQYAGIPRGFFDDIQREAAKDDMFFAMSKADDLGREGEPKLRSKAGAGGDWPIINERPSPDVVSQTDKYSCVSAVGEMLSEGRLKQADLIEKLGTPGEPVPTQFLARHLGGDWIAKAKDDADLDGLLKGAPWGTELRELMGRRYARLEPAHTVVVDGLDDAGNIMIRDPAHGTRYGMTRENFLKHWTGISVHKK